jgi:protein SCO1/2
MDAATTTVSAGDRRRELSGRRVLLCMLGILVVTFVPAVFLPNLVFKDERKLEDLGDVPAFSLVDEQGRTFTEEALRGHPTIVSFIFTRCDTVCPVIAMKVQKLEEKTRDKRGIAIKIVSISVDPEHDTPAKLAAFAERYKANPERWRFLTGDPATIRALVEGPFMSPMDREGLTTSGAPNIVHSGYVMLVDGTLKIRGVYDSNDVQRLDELLRDARYLARTQRSGYKFGGS